MKIRDDEITRTGSAKEATKAAYVVYWQCQKDLAKAEDDVADIKAQVAQASFGNRFRCVEARCESWRHFDIFGSLS